MIQADKGTLPRVTERDINLREPDFREPGLGTIFFPVVWEESLKLDLATEVTLDRPYAATIKGVQPFLEIHRAHQVNGQFWLKGEMRWEILYVGTDGRIYLKETASSFQRAYVTGFRSGAGTEGLRTEEGSSVPHLLVGVDPGPPLVSYQLEHFLGLRYGRRAKLQTEVLLRVSIWRETGPASPSPFTLSKRTVRVDQLIGEATKEIMVESQVELEHSSEAIIQIHCRTPQVTPTLAEDHVMVEGVVTQQVYYTGKGLVYSQRTDVPFSALIDLPGVNELMTPAVSVTVQGLETELEPGSRRLLERVILSFRVKVTQSLEVEVVTDLDWPGRELNVSRAQLKAKVVVGQGMAEVMLEDERPLLVPVDGVLRGTFLPPGEIKTDVLENQVILEGNILGELTLAAKDGLQYQESLSLPFSEMLSLAGARPGMMALPRVKVTDTQWETDAKGEKTHLNVTLQMEATVVEETGLEVLTEVLGPGLNVEKRHLLVERVVAEETSQFLQERRLNLERDWAQVTEIVGEVGETQWEAFPDGILIRGLVEEQIIYFDVARMARFSSREYPFSHLVRIPGISQGMTVQVRARVDHISFTLTGRREIEERVVLGVEVQVTERSQLDLVTGVVPEPWPGMPAEGPRLVGEKRVVRSARVPLGPQPAKRILDSAASVHRLEVWVEGGDYRVGGEIIFEFHYVGRDQSLRHREERLPFVERVTSLAVDPGPMAALLKNQEAPVRVGHLLTLPPGQELGQEVLLEAEFDLFLLADGKKHGGKGP